MEGVVFRKVLVQKFEEHLPNWGFDILGKWGVPPEYVLFPVSVF